MCYDFKADHIYVRLTKLLEVFVALIVYTVGNLLNLNRMGYLFFTRIAFNISLIRRLWFSVSHKQLRFQLWCCPVEHIVWTNIMRHQHFDKQMSQLCIVRLLVEFVAVALAAEFDQTLRLANTDVLHSQARLDIPDLLDNHGPCEPLALNPRQSAIHQEHKQIAERNEVVAPRKLFVQKGISGCEEQVACEDIGLLEGNVLAIFILPGF